MKVFTKSLMLLMLSSTVLLSSCSKDSSNSEEEENLTSHLTLKDIQGIWNTSNNDLYFIHFTQDGKYSFCLNKKLMSLGTFTLEKNKVTLNNIILNSNDNLEISINDKKLRLKGDIKTSKQGDVEMIEFALEKSKENLPDYIVGQQWKSSKLLNAIHGFTRDIIDVTSEYTLKYKYVKDNSLLTPIKEETWYYTYRNGLTYTQKSTSNGNVHIYRIPFWGEFSTLENLSSLEVQQ